MGALGVPDGGAKCDNATVREGKSTMVRALRLEWDDWTEGHIARHGVDRDEVEAVARNPLQMVRARGGLYRVIGQTNGGRFLTDFIARHVDGTS